MSTSKPKTLKPKYERVTLTFTKPSKTIHSQAYETDINNMVKGLTPFTQSKRPGFYIDETNLPPDYETQFNAVLAAQNAFMTLPPSVREIFGNDPGQLSQAMSDPRNHPKLRELGILAPLPSEERSPPPTPSSKANPEASDEASVKPGKEEGTK